MRQATIGERVDFDRRGTRARRGERGHGKGSRAHKVTEDTPIVTTDKTRAQRGLNKSKSGLNKKVVPMMRG